MEKKIDDDLIPGIPDDWVISQIIIDNGHIVSREILVKKICDDDRVKMIFRRVRHLVSKFEGSEQVRIASSDERPEKHRYNYNETFFVLKSDVTKSVREKIAQINNGGTDELNLENMASSIEISTGLKFPLDDIRAILREMSNLKSGIGEPADS